MTLAVQIGFNLFSMVMIHYIWDGVGCGPNNDCCDFNSPPWFRKQLPSTTTDNIEMRLCSEDDPDEDTPVEIIEI